MSDEEWRKQKTKKRRGETGSGWVKKLVSSMPNVGKEMSVVCVVFVNKAAIPWGYWNEKDGTKKSFF